MFSKTIIFASLVSPRSQNCCDLRAFLGVKFSSRVLHRVKLLTSRNSDQECSLFGRDRHHHNHNRHHKHPMRRDSGVLFLYKRLLGLDFPLKFLHLLLPIFRIRILDQAPSFTIYVIPLHIAIPAPELLLVQILGPVSHQIHICISLTQPPCVPVD